MGKERVEVQVGLEGMIDGCYGEAGSLDRRKTDEKLGGMETL